MRRRRRLDVETQGGGELAGVPSAGTPDVKGDVRRVGTESRVGGAMGGCSELVLDAPSCPQAVRSRQIAFTGGIVYGKRRRCAGGRERGPVTAALLKIPADVL